MGSAEILICALILLFIVALNIPRFRDGLGRGLREFKNESDEISQGFQNGLENKLMAQTNGSSQFLLWLAQGFGVGKIPLVPGTFGSAVGVVWFWILLLPKSPLIFVIGSIGGIFASVWICGAGEKILNQRDPGSIVMDEIIAVPICFGSWLAFIYFQKGIWPSADYFFTERTALMTFGVFLLFRLFDVAKPWPVRQSQNLPGGWGVTVDDVLAAVYVNIVVFLIWKFQDF